MLVLQAAASRALGEKEKAVSTLRRALESAVGEGYSRVFLDEGKPVLALLAQVDVTVGGQEPESGAIREYVRRLLVESDGRADATRNAGGSLPGAAPFAALTEREREVVRLVVDGASNQEIADTLVISLSTVKVHLNHIMGKLGVRNRTEAAVKAREMDLS